MTGIVLTLAGLTCGDGAPGAGAAREPVKVVVDFGKGFRGRIRLPGGRQCEIRINNSGYLAFHSYYSVVIPGPKLSADGEGRFRVTERFAVFGGTVSLERQGIILTLNPVPIRVEFEGAGDSLPETIRGLTKPRPRKP
jgi:hypothetical protein